MPVRVVAFTMLAHLEAVALVVIDQLTESDDEAVALLGDDGEAQVRALWKRLRGRRLDVSPLDVTTLAQKGRILAELNVFSDDTAQGVSDFDGVYQRLRNPVMHVGDYVSDSIDELRAFAADLDIVRRRSAELHDVAGRST